MGSTSAEISEIRFEAHAIDQDSLEELFSVNCRAVSQYFGVSEVSVRLSVHPAELRMESSSRHSLVFVPSAVAARKDACRLSVDATEPKEHLELVFASERDTSEAAFHIENAIHEVVTSLFSPLLDQLGSPLPPRELELPSEKLECLLSSLVIYTPPSPAEGSAEPWPVFELRCVDLVVPSSPASQFQPMNISIGDKDATERREADGQQRRRRSAAVAWPTLFVYTDHRRAEVLESIGLGTYCSVSFDEGSHSIMLKERQSHGLAFTSVHEAEQWAELLTLVCSLNPFDTKSFSEGSHVFHSKARELQDFSRRSSPTILWPTSPAPKPLLRALGPAPRWLPDFADPFRDRIEEEDEAERSEWFAAIEACKDVQAMPGQSDTVEIIVD